MPDVLLCQGNALHLPLKDASVHVCCTSPPYFALRRYDCGPGELGLEDSPADYIAAMVQVFREVKRVLHPMGTCWINVGTTYQDGQDLGIPWRLAFALKADGWRLRSEIIYAKLNPMPESVQTRPTRSHEQVFLFSKQAQYHYDAEAVREPSSPGTLARFGNGGAPRLAGSKWVTSQGGSKPNDWMQEQCNGRSCRSVWSIASESFSGAHYACFPQALVRRCLLAGAPSQVCAACGAPWKREVERQPVRAVAARGMYPSDLRALGVAQRAGPGSGALSVTTTTRGFSPTCPCSAGTQPCTILDPFCGSGTTLLVARELGHHAVGVDLSLTYLRDIARTRLGLTALHEWTHGAVAVPQDYGDLPLFGG